MVILVIGLIVFLFIIFYGAFFIKKLLEEINVKDHLIFNLKKSLQKEQDKTMQLSHNVQSLSKAINYEKINS